MLSTAEVDVATGPPVAADNDAVWRALANPLRRQLLDELSRGARTTGELAAAAPELSRFAVMQHLGVLNSAGLVIVRRRGRHRFNYLNAVPLRRWYERWVVPLANEGSAELLALHRHLNPRQQGEPSMATPTEEQLRFVRVENELRFRCSAERLFAALTSDTLAWFPHTYGGERTQRIVVEPRVGGLIYEDWGHDAGHLYGQVTVWDPPHRFATRGRLHAGTMLDSAYVLESDGEETVLQATKVAVGPMTDEQAAGIRTYGDLDRFADALRKVVEQ
ncbi:MAG TPA: helix-turn-helix domain-containing protein [Candidatus Limnocylindrales bacterium]|nr:helix-turn-helix domain-containing protein [Candidatus Limnocylindrales bacterium]